MALEMKRLIVKVNKHLLILNSLRIQVLVALILEIEVIVNPVIFNKDFNLKL